MGTFTVPVFWVTVCARLLPAKPMKYETRTLVAAGSICKICQIIMAQLFNIALAYSAEQAFKKTDIAGKATKLLIK